MKSWDELRISIRFAIFQRASLLEFHVEAKIPVLRKFTILWRFFRSPSSLNSSGSEQQIARFLFYFFLNL